MFDAMKNLGNLPGMMAKARELQDRMKALQEELARKTVTADAGSGRVEATVNGRLELVRIHIDSSRLNVADTAMLEELIVAAVAAAQSKAAVMTQTEMQRLASELGLPPGMLPS